MLFVVSIVLTLNVIESLPSNISQAAIVMACSHRRRGQDKTVLSCPRRRCEQAISCKLQTGSRRDKTHQNWVEARPNYFVGGVNTIGDKTRQEKTVSCRPRRRCEQSYKNAWSFETHCTRSAALANDFIRSMLYRRRPVILRPRLCALSPSHLLTLSVPDFFWLWQKWIYQSVQRHTGLTHPFNSFWHSGTRRSAQCQKN